MGIERIVFYGHSLGGFILLRLLKENGWWKEINEGVILESPMTSYRMILKENRIYNSILNPLIKKWLFNAWKKIHPKNPIYLPGQLLEFLFLVSYSCNQI